VTLEIPPGVSKEERERIIREKITDQGFEIKEASLYWYEGVGEEKDVVLPGLAMNAFWDTLDLKQKMHVAFNSGQLPELQNRYAEAVQKDFEEFGASRKLEGRREDATLVFEYGPPS